jgi:hypothetical protein
MSTTPFSSATLVLPARVTFDEPLVPLSSATVVVPPSEQPSVLSSVAQDPEPRSVLSSDAETTVTMRLKEMYFDSLKLPLDEAIRQIKFCWSAGLDENVIDSTTGQTLLLTAMNKMSYDLCQFLIENQEEIDDASVDAIFERGFNFFAKKIIDKNHPRCYDKRVEYYKIAIKKYYKDITQQLLNKYPDLFDLEEHDQTLTLPSGKVFVGKFKDGKPFEGTVDGHPGTFSDGKFYLKM